MKLNEILKRLKPSHWYQWVGYFSVGTVLASGIAIGVVVGVKDGGDNSAKPNLENKNNSTKKSKKQGKQADLPNESSKSIDINELKNNLIEKGKLDLEDVVYVLKSVGVPVDKAKGTSYDKKKGMYKVIGNKYGDITRFVGAWNKLSDDNKKSLDRHSLAYLFGKVPESNFHIGHQVEYILLDPINKKSNANPSTDVSNKSPQERIGAAANAFTKWIKELKNSDFSNLIDDSKLPSQITNDDVLKAMKDLDSFKDLRKEDQAKLTTANILLYNNKDDQSGKISIKITQDGKELAKIKALNGFKIALITQDDINLAELYKKTLKTSIENLNNFYNNQNNNLSYYEFKKGKETLIYPIVAQDHASLESYAKPILIKFGFNSKKIYSNISNHDVNKSFDGKKTTTSILKIGYINSKDQKFYLFSDNTIPFNSVEKAVDYFINNMVSDGTIEDFVKSNLNSIKKQLDDFGKSINTSILDKIISDQISSVAQAITNQLSESQKSALAALINKYLPGGSNITTEFEAKVYTKDSSGKYNNGSDELKKGASKYPASFNTPAINKKGKRVDSFNVIWGLFNAKNKKIQNNLGSLKNFKDFGSDILGNVDQIAVINSGKEDRSKKITFVFLKIGQNWIFATDYINYIEGKSPKKIVKLTLEASDAKITEAAMNKDFSDLVAYTKESLL